jgi:Bacterial Ig-like domain (group 3)
VSRLGNLGTRIGSKRLKNRLARAVLLLGAFLAPIPAALAVLPASQQSVLDALYTQTAGTAWFTSTNWENGGDPCAAAPNGWYGITCDAAGANVVSIALADNNLTGALPALNGLTALVSVDVSFDELSGSLPGLSGLSQLQTFAANNNNLTGSIPSLSGLTALTSFNVSTNNLTGAIPAFSSLPSLASFLVFNNNLTGTIPTLGGNAPALQVFNVNSNLLTGSIPTLTGNTKLVTVDFSFNPLSGSIPSLSGLTALTSFFARNDQLTGSLPSLTGLSSLLYFDVSNNALSGGIPALTGLTKLQYFDVDYNALTGSIPGVTGLTSLNAFYARNNQLIGSIPDLSNFTGTQPLFIVRSNQLSGAIPDLSATNIAVFMVQDNNLTGSAPLAPASIWLTHSALCPNMLTAASSPPTANDLAWNQATDTTPWSLYCGTLTLTSSANPSYAGQNVTLAGTVYGNQSTGSVSFLNGTTAMCTSVPLGGTALDAPNASCSTSALPPGTTTITANYASTGAYSNMSATLSQVVLASRPTLVEAISPASVGVGQAVTVTYTLTNPNTANSLVGLAFTDTLPANLLVASPSNLTGTCGGGTITATAAGKSISLSGATLAASDSCTFSVSVVASAAGAYTNTTGAVFITGGATSPAATATLNVGSGFVWVLNQGSTLAELSLSGAQMTSTGSSAAAASCGGLAFDSAGDVWAVTSGSNALAEYTLTGAPVAVSGMAAAGVTKPCAVAVDGLDNAWVVNSNNTISVVDASGAAVTPSTGYQGGGISGGASIAVDNSGSVWIANSANNTVTKVIGGAAPVATPVVTNTINNTFGTQP